MADMTADQVRDMLVERVKVVGSQKALAEELGVVPSVLGDVIRGKDEPAGKLLAALGLERVTLYRHKETADAQE